MAAKHVCHLIWFRNDLRVTDNKALSSACADPDAKVIALLLQPLSSGNNMIWLSDKSHSFTRILLNCSIHLLSLVFHWFVKLWLILPMRHNGYLITQRHSKRMPCFNRQYEWNEKQRDSG